MSTKIVFEKIQALCNLYFAEDANAQLLQAKRAKLYEQAQAKLRRVEKLDAQLDKIHRTRSSLHPNKDGAVLAPLGEAILAFFPVCT